MNAIKKPIEFITVLYVKNAFKKLTSNNNTATYIEPKNNRIVRNRKYWGIKKTRRSDNKNIKNIKNTTK